MESIAGVEAAGDRTRSRRRARMETTGKELREITIHSGEEIESGTYDDYDSWSDTNVMTAPCPTPFKPRQDGLGQHENYEQVRPPKACGGDFLFACIFGLFAITLLAVSLCINYFNPYVSGF